MRNYLRKYFLLTLCGFFSVCEFSPVFSQQSKPVSVSTGESRNQSKLGCSASAINKGEKMTYLVGAGKLSLREKKRIEEKWGVLIVPKGETERAKGIRANALAFRQKQIDVLTKNLEIWFQANPNATPEQIKKRREIQDYALENITDKKRNETRIALKKWDWRENGADVGPVMNQGEGCNTCWAFASTSAAAASLQKNYWDGANRQVVLPDMVTGGMQAVTGGIYQLLGDPSPFVQDLLNCMPIEKEEICNSGWHGTAFDFMVYQKGIPMIFSDGFTKEDEKSGKTITYRRKYKFGEKFACQPNNGFIKAMSWDYVNSPPDKLPTVLQLKTALIEHGPLVAPIHYDSCLVNYKGGVFNEKNFGKVNHVVLLVGWDDEKGAWLVKNSWGEEWGEKGFGWIKYGSNNIGVFAAWIDASRTSI